MALSKLTDIRKSLSVEIEDLQVNGITTFTGSVSIGGTLTYQDVTNVDSVGIITAQAGINITGGDLTIPDSIIHLGDTNTKIRFPAADTISLETAGNERLRITSAGLVGIATYTPTGAWLDIATGSGTYDHIRMRRISSDVNIASNWSLKPYGGNLYFREGGSTDKIVFTDDPKIGISTTNPDTPLHIYADDAQQITVERPSNLNSGIRYKNTIGSMYAGLAKDGYGWAINDEDDLGNDSMFLVDGTGDVGIGTTNPTKKLHIRTTASADGIVIKSDGNTYNQITFDANRGSNTNHIGRILANWNGGVVAYMSLDTGLDNSNKDDGQIRFFTSKESNSALERLRINQDGKLIQNYAALGSYPSNLPPVYFAGEKQNYGGLEVTMNLHDDSSDAIGNGGGINMSANNGTTIIARGGIKGHAEATGSNAGSLIFYTRPASGVLSEKMRIDSAGRITKPLQPVFYAQMTTSGYTLTTTETALVYNEAKVNVGNHYNTSDGKFTAPVTGLYEFGYAAVGHNTADVFRYTLYINGSYAYNEKPQLRIDTTQSNNQYGTNGEFVVYRSMTAGQYAQVYAKSDGGDDGFSNNSTGYTYFRGRLIG